MKSTVILSVLAGLPLLVLARPDLYKEKEDFQYSRTSSDLGNQAGYYENQRGNMGGNYENAYNMDTLAQRQYKDLSVGVGSQVATNLRAGSTFGSASTSGTEYGAAKGTHIGLTGSTNLGATGANLGLGVSNYESGVAGSNYESAANHQASQASNLNRYSSFTNRNAGRSGAVHTGSRYGTNLMAGERNTAEAVHTGNSYGADVVGLDYGLDQGQDQYYDAATGQYVQRSSHGQSSFDTSNSRTVHGNSGMSSLTRPLIVSPVRIQIVPGRPLTLPVTVQSSADRYSTNAQSHTQQVTSQANADYDAAASYGNANSYDASLDSQLQTRTGNVEPKRYQSSYSYRKEWERHGAPGVASVSPQVTIPIVAPIDNAPASSSLYGETSGSNNERTQGNLRYSSGSRVASSGRKLDSAQYSNRNSYASGLDSQLAVDSRSQINLANSANIRSQNTLAAEQQILGASQLSQTNEAVTPKSYQSSYSYHKSWERHGTPYVIKPATLIDGSVALNADLDAAVQLQANQQSHQSSAAHSSNAYHSQSSSAALTDASNSRYQTGGNLCDSNCYAAYIRDENDNKFRNKRSASNYKHHRSEQDDMHETSDNLDQQLQSFNQEIEDDGQQIEEDFGQKSLDQHIDEGQQIEEFDQANIPAETNTHSSLNVGINYDNPYNYNIKPNDERFSLSFPRPQSNFNVEKDRSIHQQPLGPGFDNHFHNSWRYHAQPNFHTQLGYGQTYHEDATKVNDNIFSEIERISKEIAVSMDTPLHQSPLVVTDSFLNPPQTVVGYSPHPVVTPHSVVDYNPSFTVVDYSSPHYGHNPHHNFHHHASTHHNFGHEGHAPYYHSFGHEKHDLNPHNFGHDRHFHEKHLFLHKDTDLDENCDKHKTATTVRSMTEDDILRRIHELQKDLNIGQNTFVTSRTVTTYNIPKSTTVTDKNPIKPQLLEPNVIYDTREKTPEEIEALSLTRNTTEKPHSPRKPEYNLLTPKTDNDSKDNQSPVAAVTLHSEQELDVGQHTQDFDQQLQDFDQQIQSIEPKPVSLGHKVQEFDQKPNNNRQETTEFDLEQKIQGFEKRYGNFDQKQDKEIHIIQQNQNNIKPKTQDFSQFPKDMGQASEQTAIVSTPKYTQKDVNKQSRNYEQSSEDIGQQLQGFSQENQDFGQQPEAFGQQEDIGQQQEIIGQQQEDIGQQQEDIGQQQEDIGQQQEDIGQQQEDVGQQQENIGQQQEDIGQQQEDIGHQQIGIGKQDLEQQTQVVAQIPDDDGEDTLYVGQQTQSIGQLPKAAVEESQDFDIGQLPENVDQQTQDFGQMPADVSQQTQDIGQQTQDEFPEDIGQQTQDFGQKPVDLGQTPEEIEVYLNQRNKNDSEDVGLGGVSSQLVNRNDQKPDTLNMKPIQDDDTYKNLEIVETTTIKPGFWKNIGSKLKNTFG